MDLTGWWVGGSRAKAWATQADELEPRKHRGGAPTESCGEVPGTAGAE